MFGCTFPLEHRSKAQETVWTHPSWYETQTEAYFLPAVWEAAQSKLPDHVLGRPSVHAFVMGLYVPVLSHLHAISCALGFQRNFLEWNVKNDTVIKGVQSWLHNVTGFIFSSSVPVCLAESMPFSVGLWRCWSSSSTKAWSPNSTGCSLWRAGRKRNPGAFFGVLILIENAGNSETLPSTEFVKVARWMVQPLCWGKTCLPSIYQEIGHLAMVRGVSRGDEFVFTNSSQKALCSAQLIYLFQKQDWFETRKSGESRNQQRAKSFFWAQLTWKGKHDLLHHATRLIPSGFCHQERGSSAWWQRIKRLSERLAIFTSWFPCGVV